MTDPLHPRALDRLQQLAAGAHEQVEAPPAPPPPRVARYRIEEPIGEGATAVVYRAFDIELGRPVALKVLKTGAGLSDSMRERFGREARMIAGLDHPHVVRVHDAGETEGRPFIVMELVDGRSLDRSLREEKHPLALRMRQVAQAARGVAAAHEKGIIHRDLKPANILIGKDGAPKVTDFGLGRAAEGEMAVTRDGAVLGTPMYMAPEQVEGRHAEISPRTDVYALGAVLYETLTGRPPHHSEVAAELYRRILLERPVRPRDMNGDVPADLEAICLKALEKKAMRRYRTAGDLADDLDRHLAGEPVLAGTRPARRWRRVTGIASLLLAGIVAGLLLLHRERNEEAVRLHVEAARHRLEQLVRRLGGPDVSVAEFNQTLAGVEGQCRQALAIDPRHPEACLVLGQRFQLQWQDEQALEWFNRAIDASPSYVAPYLERMTLGVRGRMGVTDPRHQVAEDMRRVEACGARPEQLVFGRALVASLMGEFEKSAALLEEYLAQCPADLRARALRGRALLELGRNGEAEAEFTRQLEGHRLDLDACEARGYNRYMHLQRYEDALADFDRAIEISATARPSVYLNRGGAKYKLGDLQGAVRDYDEALRLGYRDAGVYANRAAARLDLKDVKGALEDVEESLRLDPANAQAYQVRAIARRAQGDAKRAASDLEEAIRRKPNLGYAYYVRGVWRCADGDRRGALPDFEEAIRRGHRTPEAWHNLGAARLANGDFDGAIRDASEAIRLDPAGWDNYHLRGLCRRERGEYRAAIPDYAKALELMPPGDVQRPDLVNTLAWLRMKVRE